MGRCRFYSARGGAGNQPPTADNDSGFIATDNTPLSIPASALLANDLDPNGFTLSITGVSNPTNGTVSYDATAQTVTFVPTTGYPVPKLHGNGQLQLFDFKWKWWHGDGLSHPDGQRPHLQPVQLQTAVPGTITVMIRARWSLESNSRHHAPERCWEFAFIKVRKIRVLMLGICGVRPERCWRRYLHRRNSHRLASRPSFLARYLTTGATYVVSYHTTGFYSADGNYFASALTSGPLTAPSSAASSGNGVYAYGSISLFPTGSFNAANYWVDVVFAAAGALGNQPPTANNDSGFVAVSKRYAVDTSLFASGE